MKATHRTIDSEEAKTRGFETVKVVVRVGHELHGFLGRGIRRDRMINILHLGKESRLGTAINRRG